MLNFIGSLHSTSIRILSALNNIQYYLGRILCELVRRPHLRLSHGIVKSISGTPALASFYKEAQFAFRCWTAQASGHLPPGADFGTLFSKPSILKTRPRTNKLRRME